MTQKTSVKPKYQEVPISSIVETEGRLRMEIDEEGIEELARSIESLGLRQAIEVVKRGEGYEIVYGERRYLAHKALGRDKIMAKIVELTDDQIALIRAMENTQRLNLSPIEEAASYKDLQDRFSLTNKEVAKKLGINYSTIKRKLDLLKMDRAVQKAVHKKLITMSVAEELWRCPDEGHRNYLLELAVEHGVTRDVLRGWVSDYLAQERSRESARGTGGDDPHPLQGKPIYQACDICNEAVKIEEIKHLGICKGCGRTLRNAMEDLAK